ncbi:MAG: cell surface protein SprA [Bacteroidota bacterium]
MHKKSTVQIALAVLCGFLLGLGTAAKGASPTDFGNGALTGGWPFDSVRHVIMPVDTPPPTPGDPTTTSDPGGIKLNTPPNIKTRFELDEEGTGYYIHEEVGDIDIRPPSHISLEEYLQWRRENGVEEFWQERSLSSNDFVDGGALAPKFAVNSEAFRDIFGGGSVEIRPNGTALIDLGAEFNRSQNPSLPIRQQRNANMRFDQQIQLNVVGKIGEKLRLNANWDTQATFDFENQLKLEFTGTEDEIIQKIEAGNVSLPLNGSLISGGQNLFGIKVAMKFGPVLVTSIASQQKGRTQAVTATGGAQVTEFRKKGNEYDENRHFFLSHFFRNRYEYALQGRPNINSPITITRVEAYITNNNSASTTDNRNAVGFIDLGETEIAPNGGFPNQRGVLFNDQWTQQATFPDNGANDLFQTLKAAPNAADYEDKTSVVDGLTNNLGLINGVDFDLIENMRKLNENEFFFHPQLGYVSLNTPLQPNQVLYVAFEYMQGGQVYQVGEFTLDKPSNDLNSNVLFLKMLKPGQVRPVYDGAPYPTWDLMMKNIYSIGGFGITRDNFRLDIMLDSRTQAGDIPVLPSGPQRNIPLIRVFGLDTLQNNAQQGPDGIFDFLEGITMVPDKGLVIFPVLEPFGDWLRAQLENDPEEVDQYVFDTLYSATRMDAIQYGNDRDRFYIVGSYQGRSSSEIPLNSINVAPGSVKVTANGITLQEGIDYRVDYNIGKVIMLNEGILTSGQELNVTFETNTLFGIDTKTLLGTRVDVLASKDIQFGGTILHLNERPLTNKINIGDEPISNVIWGLDGVLRKDSKFITRMIDKLPLIQTSEISTVQAQGEFAQLLPGHPRAIQVNGEAGIAYLDDFESAKTTFDLMGFRAWTLASYPGDNGNNNMFVPQGGWNPALSPGFSRAKLAWYSIDQSFYFGGAFGGNTPSFPSDNLNNHYMRQVSPTEVFPNQTLLVGNNQQRTFDMRFVPNRRGMYNYEVSGAVLNPDGTFQNPEDMWGGIQRRTSGNTDFEAANFEFIEFWMLDPFIYDQENSGEFYINLGQISEDVLPDNVRNFENGLPGDPADTTSVAQNEWSRYPLTTPPIQSFNNEPESREFQDVGLDGLWDDLEREKFDTSMLNLAAGVLNPGPLAALREDPSSDNYVYFRDNPETVISILERYEKFTGLDGNTPINSVEDGFSTQGSPNPDTEDLNLNGTLNTNEEYWEYKMNFQPSEMQIGRNFIVDIIPADVSLPNGNVESVNWYQFRIPLTSGKAINNIQNFKAIEFVRMYMKGWSEEVVLRFARFQLVSTSWRTVRDYLGEQGDTLITDPQPGTTFEIGTVNVEENSNRQPFPYVLPPQILRQQQVASPQPGLLQNEQAIVLKTCGLQDGDARGAFKLVNFDFRSYRRLKMWIHAENVPGSAQDFQEGELRAFIRLGSDTRENYYEYEIPIGPSEPGATDSLGIWSNNMDIELADLGVAKSARDAAGWPVINRFLYENVGGLPDGHRVYVVGTPKLSDVKGLMIGIRNEKDGLGPICTEVWMNELRLVDFDEEAGWAANARVSLKLADFATINASGSIRTPGFGALEQKIYNRSRETTRQFDVAGNFNLGKFFPKDWGIQLPLYVTYGERVVNPDFNPLESDVRMTNYLETIEASARDSVLFSLQDRRVNKSISMNNIRKVRTRRPTASTGRGGGKGGPKTHPWDIENFALSLSYNETFSSNHLTDHNITTNHRAQISYNYNFNSKPWEPFKKAKKKNLITAFNFNPLPKTFSVSVLGDRRYEENEIRTSANGIPIQPTWLKNFSLTRTYNLRWDFTKSLSLNYTATNTGRVDEALVGPTNEFNNDTLWQNFLSFGRQEGAFGLDSLGRDKTVNFGRNIRFQQNVGLNYILPFDKFSLTNWINGTVSYQGGYNWQAAPDNNLSLGNQINNSQSLQANGRLNMDNLYNKVRFLRNLMADAKTPSGGRPRPGTRPGDEDKEKKDKKKKKKKKRKKDEEEGKEGEEGEEEEEEEEDDTFAFLKALGKGIGRVLLSVKNVDMTYGRNMSTSIAGYMPGTDNFGLDFNYSYIDPEGNFQQGPGTAPGIPFVLGWQPEVWQPSNVGNEFLLNQFAANGWISNDPNLATPFNQNWSEQFSARTSVTLFRDFKIDLNVTKNHSRNYSELFRFSDITDRFMHENQLLTGQYSVSYIFLGTAFESNSAETGTAFAELQGNTRRIISQRLAESNPEYASFLANAGVAPTDILTTDAYFQGYYRNSQDVLIPAFRAAYGSGKAESASLTPFPAIPLPNWTINYNGLGRIPALKEIFRSVTIRHSYRGTYTVGGFTSNVRFDGNPSTGFDDTFFGASLDPIAGDSIYNIRSQYVIPQVAFSESFAPLAGVNVNFKNGISASVDLKMSRNVSMSVGNTQITESRNKDFSISLSYRKDKLNKTLQLFGRSLNLQNSLNSRLEVSLRDSKTRNQKLDFEGNEDFTGGNFMLIIKPSIDYVVNSKLNVRMYFEHTRNRPAISTSFPSSFSAVGFQVRFTLAN